MLNILVELIIVAMLCEIIHIFEYIWIHSNNLQYGRMFDFRYLARGADYRGSNFPIYFTTTWHEIPFQSIQTYHNQSSRYGLLSLQYLGRVDCIAESNTKIPTNSMIQVSYLHCNQRLFLLLNLLQLGEYFQIVRFLFKLWAAIKELTNYYHRQRLMVFNVTITIGAIISAQPLESIIFRWFSDTK